MQLLDCLSREIEISFRKYPRQFFTEHDIHTQLALIATRLLEKIGGLYGQTCDGYTVSRVHHEYPTPFRCLMRRFEFELITEERFRREKRVNPSFRARRGFLDFVIINKEHISSNRLSVVSGKKYKEIQEMAGDRRSIAIDLAIEVVYDPTFDEKLHDGIMDSRVTSTLQDYQKLVALMVFDTKRVPYCREAAMMFFSNTRHKAKLAEKFANIKKHEKVAFYSFFAG